MAISPIGRPSMLSEGFSGALISRCSELAAKLRALQTEGRRIAPGLDLGIEEFGVFKKKVLAAMDEESMRDACYCFHEPKRRLRDAVEALQMFMRPRDDESSGPGPAEDVEVLAKDVAALHQEMETFYRAVCASAGIEHP